MRLLLLVVLVMLTPSSLPAQRSRRGCPDVPPDSIPAGVRVYQPCQVDREAKQRGNPPRLDWAPASSELRDGSCFRAEFEFVVDTAGFPELATIHETSSNNAGFSQAVRDAIFRLRYEPARREGAPVRQLVAYRQSAAVRRVLTSSPYVTPPASRPPRC